MFLCGCFSVFVSAQTSGRLYHFPFLLVCLSLSLCLSSQHCVSFSVFERYKSYSPYDMKESICKEVKGDLEKSFLTLGTTPSFSPRLYPIGPPGVTCSCNTLVASGLGYTLRLSGAWCGILLFGVLAVCRTPQAFCLLHSPFVLC